MCGIAGFIGIKQADYNIDETIFNMTKSLTHRGPDDDGYMVIKDGIKNNQFYAVFGHRRLKIIDLSKTGHQPMSNSNGSMVISYNGEIYNYLELKEELIKKGYQFISTSDTEVFMKAYEEWGIKCFSRFNGMWAAAIFDKKKRKIILSRDRFGKKPLYYYRNENTFIFASEIKAILKHPYCIKKPNYEKIFRYLATHYRYVDIDDDSYFENIHQVSKSTFMEVDEYLNIKTASYWDLDTRINRQNISDKAAINEFKDLFVDAVRLRLRSDVSVGCALSGGMDSTSITCVAYKILKHPIITFSGITGDIKGVYDESEYIDAVIKETEAVSHYIKPDPLDIFDTVEEMLAYHDEPICTVTWYSLYLIAKKIKFEHAPVLLNGHGGDELLAGYWDHYHYYFYDLGKKNDNETLQHEIKCWEKNHGREKKEIEDYRLYISKLVKNKISPMSQFPDYSSCFDEELVEKYKRDITFPKPYDSLLSNRLYDELLFETIPASLRPEDRNTMSQSIESRSPFLDYRLVEYCFSLPSRLKIRHGLGKWLLREAMQGILPEKVRLRKDKAGFIAPADKWFRTVNRKQICDLINSDSLIKRNLYDIKYMQKIFEEHLSEAKNHQMFLWRLINLELWFKKFF